MTDPPHSTMAATTAADLSRATPQARIPTADPPAQQAAKNHYARIQSHDLSIFPSSYGNYEI